MRQKKKRRRMRRPSPLRVLEDQATSIFTQNEGGRLVQRMTLAPV
jgi:hypothetical protein